jgi:hypothetical protein
MPAIMKVVPPKWIPEKPSGVKIIIEVFGTDLN